MHGSPPSSRSYLVRIPGVIEAGGVLRDMLGSLRNLDQLVRSMRVGPKGLERAIADVHSGCADCAQAAHSLIDLLKQALPSPAGLDGLEGFVGQRMAEMTAALDQATRQQMTARNRLALEQALTQLLPQLEAGRDLLELLAEAAWAPEVLSPLMDLLFISQVPEEATIPRVTATIEESLDDFEVNLPPSMTHISLNILTSAFYQRHGRGPVLQLRATGDDYCLEMNTSDAPGREVTWPLQYLVAPSVGVAAAALEARNCAVSLEDFPRLRLSKEVVRRRSAEA